MHREKIVSRILAALLLASIVDGVLVEQAAAEGVAEFYKGKAITMIVGSEAGGGYDVYARLLARHLGKHVPGNPSFVVQNRPGAGSVIATNYIASVAPQDGSVILAPNRTAAFVQLLGQTGARYQAAKLNWLGSLNNEVGVLELARAAPAKTMLDVRRTAIIVGSTAAGSDGDVYPALMNMTLGTKFRIVRGYSGTAAIDLAIQRGEVEAQSDSFSSVEKRWPDWREKINLIVQLSLSMHPNLADVPLIFDYIRPEFAIANLPFHEIETAWRIMLAPKEMGRPFVLGPQVPPERLKALRNAFRAVVQDPEFRADAQRGRNEIVPISGEEIQSLLTDVSSAPQSVIDLLQAAISYRVDEAGPSQGPR
jgi:tripartite-type tricarboxylate transporter receptor subunit TctC